MRMKVLRTLGLVLIVWVVAATTPARRAGAQPACTLLCPDGQFCCATLLNGHIHMQCELDGDPCPKECTCTLLCVQGKHCCAGITLRGVCTQTCVPDSTPCAQ